MKKLLTVLFFAAMLVGCSSADDEQSKKSEGENVSNEQQPLAMQLLKADEENGVTLEEEMYQYLTEIVQSNPDIGVADDFSIHPIDLVEQKTGEPVLLYLGINRLEQPIKNITFEYTLGYETEGDQKFVLNHHKVELSESFVGTIQPNHAIPFTMTLTDEGKAILQEMTKGSEENKIVKLENATFELVD